MKLTAGVLIARLAAAAAVSCAAGAFVFAAGALVFAAGAAAANTDPEARGQALLEDKCGRCHSVGAAGASTHAQAPPFRQVVTRYAPENLAESLAEGIVSGHPDMPVFTFEPADIEAIVTYLNSLIVPASK